MSNRLNQNTRNIMYQRRMAQNQAVSNINQARRESAANQRNFNPRNYVDRSEQSNNMDESRRFLNNIEESIQDTFNEFDYLTLDAPSSSNETYSANGVMNEVIVEETVDNINAQVLKRKALELETLIMDSLARDKKNEAKQYFNTLKLMNQKYRDNNVKDVYLRVLQSMPKETSKSSYSAASNKNQFKDILNKMKPTREIKALNEVNPCVNSLGDMWDTCDANICNQRCADAIKKSFTTMNTNDCSNLVTGMDGDKKIRMNVDIQNIILQRLKYCKKIQEMKKDGMEEITYRDQADLKNKIIKDIHKFITMANRHYSLCPETAKKFVTQDKKYSEIINLLNTIDLTKMNLDKLQSLRNDIVKLPNCETLKYNNYQESREPEIRNGVRVGDYVIPKNSQYLKEMREKNKGNPSIYKDLATGKNYFYDVFSKTLTGLDYPITKTLDVGNDNNTLPIPAPSNSMNNSPSHSGDEDLMKLIGMNDLIVDSPPPVETELNNTPSYKMPPIDSNNLVNNAGNNLVNNRLVNMNNNIIDTQDDSAFIIFGINLTNIFGYALLVFTIFVIIFVFVEFLKQE